MTIDERIEALTRNVELNAKMQEDNEKLIRRLGKYVRVVAQMALDHEARLRALEGEGDGR